ncbi:glycoside hydrolase family 43 protein [Xylariaceae sp. FL0662B]|nr:glycoside hydrolase family 43 protein [Xylariaceae sp. FL0662B]
MPPSRRIGGEPSLDPDFPDPSIIQDEGGSWYAFGTAGNGNQIQVAKADDLYGPWDLLDTNALEDAGPWASGRNTWAPDVRRLRDGSYVMYYSGEVKSDRRFHCIGAAVSETITGPYTPYADPFACDLSKGGAIDASGFEDADGKQYVVYKVDGNSLGHGGSCMNDKAPIVATPILMQEVGSDGVSRIGDPVQIFDRSKQDGPLVEAPSLLRTDEGLYVLFFSSGCYTEESYNVNYATSTSLTGPYQRADKPILITGQYNMRAPGGATGIFYKDGIGVAFHADCPAGRCLYTSDTVINGREVRFVM